MPASRATMLWLEAGHQEQLRCVMDQDLWNNQPELQPELGVKSLPLLAVVRADTAYRPGQSVLIDQHGQRPGTEGFCCQWNTSWSSLATVLCVGLQRWCAPPPARMTWLQQSPLCRVGHLEQELHHKRRMVRCLMAAVCISCTSEQSSRSEVMTWHCAMGL